MKLYEKRFCLLFVDGLEPIVSIVLYMYTTISMGVTNTRDFEKEERIAEMYIARKPEGGWLYSVKQIAQAVEVNQPRLYVIMKRMGILKRNKIK